jgi:hypothetical protein
MPENLELDGGQRHETNRLSMVVMQLRYMAEARNMYGAPRARTLINEPGDASCRRRSF